MPTRLAPKMNWNRVISDLNDAGCSCYRLGQILGVGWSTVQSWRDVKGDVGYGNGRALLRIHAEYCGAALTTKRQLEAEAVTA